VNKRERLELTTAGELTDRPPVAAWRHFAGDDLRAADLARAALDFQNTYDWDLLLALPAPHSFINDYGGQDEWRGDAWGERVVLRSPIRRSLDWTDLRAQDPQRGDLAKYFDALRLLGEAVGTIPLVAWLPSPLLQAQQLAGRELFLRHMRTQPDRLRSGLNTLTETTLRWLEALRRLPLAGVYYAVNADLALLSEDEYRTFGLPYDHKLFEMWSDRWWLRMVGMSGQAVMFRLCADYPIQALHWADRQAEPDLVQGKAWWRGMVVGGLSAQTDLLAGLPSMIRERVRETVQKTAGRRVLLAPDVPVSAATPHSHLRALRQAVEEAR
jgi:uroporphyrinogen decarboxylase